MQGSKDFPKDCYAMCTKMDYLTLTFTVYNEFGTEKFDFLVHTKKGLIDGVESWIFPDNQVLWRAK